MRLYLFDVDGTLISAHGAGRLALTRALEDTYGTAGPADLYDSRGKTDPHHISGLVRMALTMPTGGACRASPGSGHVPLPGPRSPSITW